jgi:hypothetical protein
MARPASLVLRAGLVGILAITGTSVLGIGAVSAADARERVIHVTTSDSGTEAFQGLAAVGGTNQTTVHGFHRVRRPAVTGTFGPCTDPTAAACADDVWQFPDGETLTLHDEGHIVGISGPPQPQVGALLRWADVLTVTGGTGRFVGATGTITTTGFSKVVDYDSAANSYTKQYGDVGVGTLTVVVRPGLDMTSL